MKAKITLLVLTFCLTNVFGQVKENEILSRNDKGLPKIIKLKETKVSDDLQTIQNFLKKQYKAGSNTEFKRKSNPETKNNFKTEKLQQYYKGIKVEFAVLNVTSINEELKSINGNFIPIENLKTAPRIVEKEALEIALKHIGAKEYAWQNKDKENIKKQVEKSDNVTYFPKGELVIIEKNRYSDKLIPTLAYKFDIYALNPISRKNYYVDANNGKIIFEDAILKHVEGIASTQYSGNRTIETQQSNGQFRLRDVTRGNGITTYNNFNQTSHTNTHYTDNDNNWTAVEYNNANNDNAGLDAHWGTMMTYDYFSQTHNRNSIDNNGYVLINYVNNNLTGWGFPNSDNAFWDGNVMTYGMGTALNPLVSIDIIAHEIGHGLDQNTSDLIYQNESGAIDEGLSDIWGAMVEFFAAPEKQTYNLGEDVGLSLRSMSNPKSQNDPDTYGGDFWFTGTGDNGGVHTNSGILNHWFYLLAEGSSATDEINDNGDAFSFSGIGKLKASKIIYRAQTVYFTPTTDYEDARELTILAAEDLYGTESVESITSCMAWFSVGVGNANCGLAIDGNDILCGNNSFSLVGIFPNETPLWSTSSYLNEISSNNTSITVEPSSSLVNGNATITANVDGKITTKKIWVGKPRLLTAKLENGQYLSHGSFPNQICKYEQIKTDITIGGDNFASWSLISSSHTTSWGQQGNNLSFYLWGINHTATFRITLNNECGIFTRDYTFTAKDCSGGGDDPCQISYTVSPNPASTDIEIIPNIPAPCDPPIIGRAAQMSTATLYDFTGNPILTKTPAEGTMSVVGLKRGHYVLVITNGASRVSHKIVVNSK